MLETALDKEVTKTIDHERIGLGNDGFNNLVFLLRGPDLEFLLKEDGCLLVIVADNLVNNVLPITVDVAVKKTAIVQGLGSGQIGLSLGRNGLNKEGQCEQHDGA